MDILLSVCIAVLPGIALALAMYIRDHHEPEPLGLLALAFGLGIAAFLVSLIPESVLRIFIEDAGNILESRALHAFGTIALAEELCKFVVVRYILYPNPNFNEPLDGIVYSVMTGLGFATMENLVYVYRDGMDSGLLRMFTAVPAHAAFAVVMGYFLGIARFTDKHESAYVLLAILSAVFLHGLYDYFIFISFLPGMWIGAVISLLVSVWLAFRAIKIHQAASPFQK